ncbi:MAG TPA: helix-turn-helix transcriptional regulator [Xanthobacteraceae bacterium]|jgi:DNA-binding XRE family transcriptional regulator
MKVKFANTQDGEVAIVPRAEYDRLKELAQEAEENAGTARLVARAKQEVAKGTPLLPKDVVDRLTNGENPIRVLREFRKYTQAELVVALAITQGYLSDLETGKRKGPMELHQKIASALGVPLDLLVPIAVSLEQADPGRLAKRKRVVADMKRLRGQR